LEQFAPFGTLQYGFAGGPGERTKKGKRVMRTYTRRFGLALAVAGMLSFMAQPAYARPHGIGPLGGLGKALAGAASHHGKGGGLPNLSRAIRVGGHSGGQNLGNLLGQGFRNSGHGGSQNLGGLLGQGLRNGSSGHGNSQNLGGLLGQGLRNGSIGHGEILQSLIGQGYGNGYGNGGYGHGYGYDNHGYDMPEAYRDVGIANAVVGLVGIAAQAAQNSQYYQYAQPVQQYYKERVLVSPSHYETRQVWIPESFDPQTGAKIGGGFYENRTELVPEVYEERMVPAPVAVPAPAPIAMPYGPPPMPPVTMHGPNPWGNPAYGTVR